LLDKRSLKKSYRILPNNKIPNIKHQITNKSQIPITSDQNRMVSCLEF